MRFDRRGVSPVIAVVLLLMLVISITAFVFSWGVGFFNDQTGDSHAQYSAGKVCDSVDIVVTLTGFDGSDTYDFEAVNRGGFDVSYLKFELVSGGNSEFVDSSSNLDAGKSVDDSFTSTTSFELDELVAYAVIDKDLVGTKDDAVCDKKILVDAYSALP